MVCDRLMVLIQSYGFNAMDSMLSKPEFEVLESGEFKSFREI